MAARSLAGRLLRGLGLAVVAAWIASTILAGLALKDELDEAWDIALRQMAKGLAPFAVEAVAPGLDAAPPAPGLLRFDGATLAYQIRAANGDLLMRSADAPTEAFAVPLHRGFGRADGFRIHTVAFDGGFLHVAQPQAYRRDEAFEAFLGLLWPLALLLPVVLLLVRSITRRSLAPLDDLRREIERRGGDNLTPMPDAGLPSELRPIVLAANRLLDRLRRTLDAERGFSANAAHELRTPVAGAIAEAQLLADDLPDGPAQDRLARIERSLKRVGRLSEKLLDLARAEATAYRLEGRVDLVPALRLVLDEFRAAPIDLEPAAPRMEGRIDRDAFAVVARNLIENALRHGLADERVRVRVEDAALVVTNGGPAVDAGSIETLTERFRHGAAASAGSGLGLAIADTIARRSGAVLSLRSPAPGRADGFEARFDLGD
ncbi:HAMP domain-containing sensor histidine kinase [Amaricoccus sp.]|uniref:sensor histidine kinase n=1 Tax=Amaricoccus sp. TaxID=1872485 RepID=UPI001B4BD6A6|nr:HAMP domain-containing sensor histidine kinase [Amaricoccus sp.]MBP7002760.1 HAMP domain-containing histidine kinase [Amaricoccus sp.]